MAIDVSFILLYGACVLGSGAVVCWLIFHVPFPPYTAAIISVEQVGVSAHVNNRICMNRWVCPLMLTIVSA